MRTGTLALLAWVSVSVAMPAIAQTPPAGGADGVPGNRPPTSTPAAASKPDGAGPEAPTGAAATTPTTSPADNALSAQELYERGLKELSKGEYAEAERSFLASYDKSTQAPLLLRIAEVQERQHRKAEAAATLELYLKTQPNHPDRERIAARIAGLRDGVAIVALDSEPSGADILVDESPTQMKTPAELRIAPGEHVIKLSAPRYRSATAPINASIGVRYEKKFTLTRAQPPPEAELPFGARDRNAAPLPSDEQAEAAGEDGLPTAVWVAAGVGAAGLITGTVLGFLALADHSQYERTPTEKIADRGERLALFSDVGFGVAVAAGLTALVLWVTHDEPGAKDASAESSAKSASAATTTRSKARLLQKRGLARTPASFASERRVIATPVSLSVSF